MQNTQTPASVKMDPNKEKMLAFIDSQLVHDFVGAKYPYYKDKWEQVLINRKFLKGINWTSLFLGPIWMAYRKMYLYLLIFIVASLLMVVFDIPAVLTLIPLAIAANVVYFLYVRNKIVGLYEKFKEPEALKKAAKRYGGTSVFASAIITVVLAVVIALNLGYMNTMKKTFQDRASIAKLFEKADKTDE